MTRRITAAGVKAGAILVLAFIIILVVRFHHRSKPYSYPSRADRYYCEDYRNWSDVKNFVLPQSDKFCQERGL